jgi:hypothetical protein
VLGFIKKQEKKVALRLLAWQYQKYGLPLPAYAEIERQADRLVDEAHRIARERGQNVLGILKELVADVGRDKK